MSECSGELADATMDSKHYVILMQKHMKAWQDQAYSSQLPVRLIGLQVSSNNRCYG